MSDSNLLGKIEQLMKEFDKLLPIKPEYKEKLWKKLCLEWNFNSNHIEGNTLTYGQTKLLLMFEKTTGDHDMREYEEMKAHDVAIKMVTDMASDREHPLTETFIRQLNEIILVKPFWKEAITSDGQPTRREIIPGKYKKFPNSVRLSNGELFNYASPEETPFLMQELIKFYNIKIKIKTNPLLLAALMHYKFVRIHPFDDGNGRIARLLMNYILLKYNYPPLIIKSTRKKEYLDALAKADSGDINAFIKYLAEEFEWSFILSIKAAKGEEIEEPEDLDKKIALFERELSNVRKEEEIQKFFNKDVFFEIFNTWITELLKEVIPVVQKFNHLFNEIKHQIFIYNSNVTVIFANEKPEKIISELFNSCQVNNAKINYNDTEIKFSAVFLYLKKGGIKNINCSFNFGIEFKYTKYIIYMEEFKEGTILNHTPFFEKLLHKSLTNSEIKDLAKMVGENIYRIIDYLTKEAGIR